MKEPRLTRLSRLRVFPLTFVTTLSYETRKTSSPSTTSPAPPPRINTMILNTKNLPPKGPLGVVQPSWEGELAKWPKDRQRQLFGSVPGRTHGRIHPFLAQVAHKDTRRHGWTQMSTIHFCPQTPFEWLLAGKVPSNHHHLAGCCLGSWFIYLCGRLVAQHFWSDTRLNRILLIMYSFSFARSPSDVKQAISSREFCWL